MVQVVRREDAKRLERPSPDSRRSLGGFVPLAEPPAMSFRELMKAALEKGNALAKAMESPETALNRAAAEPIAVEIILAPYRERLVFKMR